MTGRSATTPESGAGDGLELGGRPAGYRSGFVSIVGRPNVGKSTLLNQLLRRKVSIVSERPQTTRNTIRGVLTTPEAQIVFLDTPGLHKPHTALGKRLNRAVRNTLDEVDAVLFVVDVADGVGRGDSFIAGDLAGVAAPVVVALNKVDLADEASVRSARVRLAGMADWVCVPVSAKAGTGMAELVGVLKAAMPEGPLHYPPDTVTDRPEAWVIAELIREKALELTVEEVPHSVAVVVEGVESDEEGGGLEISATIYVERSSQKAIVIGRRGQMLKAIGTRARRDIEALLATHVFLDLRVKVDRDWQRHESRVARFGYGE